MWMWAVLSVIFDQLVLDMVTSSSQILEELPEMENNQFEPICKYMNKLVIVLIK